MIQTLGRALRASLLASIALIPLVGAAPVRAQTQQPRLDPGRTEVSRESLTELLERFEQTATSPAYSETIRAQARSQGDIIRSRLTAGDFQVGDQIALAVEGEEQLSATFVVQPGPSLILPEIGTVSLQGVLRSELEGHLREVLGRYIRSPSVRAQSSIRVMVTGAVGRAGYYVLPTNALFSDILMATGGPAAEAQLQQMRVERLGSEIWAGNALQQAIIEGRTLDQMSLQAGDHVVVPVQSRGGPLRNVLAGVSGVAMLITAALQIFR